MVDLTSSNQIAANFNSQVAIYAAGDCTDFSTFSLVQAADNGFGQFSLIVNPTVNSIVNSFVC